MLPITSNLRQHLDALGRRDPGILFQRDTLLPDVGFRTRSQRSSSRQQETITNCRNVRPVVAQIDGGSIQGIGVVHRGHGPFKDETPETLGGRPRERWALSRNSAGCN